MAPIFFIASIARSAAALELQFTRFGPDGIDEHPVLVSVTVLTVLEGGGEDGDETWAVGAVPGPFL